MFASVSFARQASAARPVAGRRVEHKRGVQASVFGLGRPTATGGMYDIAVKVSELLSAHLNDVCMPIRSGVHGRSARRLACQSWLCSAPVRWRRAASPARNHFLVPLASLGACVHIHGKYASVNRLSAEVNGNRTWDVLGRPHNS